MTSATPTEPGWYLFVGAWTDHEASAQLRHTRPELICVGRDASGLPIYLGREIRHPPALTGVWCPVDVAPLVEAARPLLIDVLAKAEIDWVFRHQGAYPMTRTLIEDRIRGSFGALPPEYVPEIVDAAIRLGFLVERAPNRFARA